MSGLSPVDEIKDRLDIVEVVGASVKLRRSGKNYVGFCPFHPNVHTPAFVVFPESGTWRCFGACNDGGDVFKFVMKKEGWDFKEALRQLAARAGVELGPREAREEADEAAHARLRQALEAAVLFYRHHLLDTEAGKPVLDYLRQRGLQAASLEAFEIGYAPHGWDATLEHLGAKGFTPQEMLDAGLLTESAAGKTYDRFRNRIMIPIRDGRGRLAGFGARVVAPEDVPKFLNSPQTAIFDKGRLLYGLDKARQSMRATGEAVLVEGYMDVIGLHQAGKTNVVSPMGTALTETQMRLLKRFSRRVVLALDADVAGYQATMRGLEVARQSMDREMDPVFAPRGLVRFEGRLDADIRVATLPEGLDPDELVAEDPGAWDRLIQQAPAVVDYVMEVLCRDQDLDNPKVKSEIANSVLPLIEDVADPVEREAYRQSLARRIRVDERALAPASRPASGPRRRQPKGEVEPAEPAPSPRPQQALEQFCLGMVLRDPELLYTLDRVFQELGLERVSPDDFTGTQRQVIFRAARQSLAQDQEEPALYWQGELDPALAPEAMGLVEELEVLGRLVSLDLQQRKVADDVVARFLQLRKQRLELGLNQAQFRLLEAQEAGEASSVEDDLKAVLVKQVMELASNKARLERALGGKTGENPYASLTG
jgi:DNA primase